MEMVISASPLLPRPNSQFRSLSSNELTVEGEVHTRIGGSSTPSVTDVSFKMVTARSTRCLELLRVELQKLKPRILYLTCLVKPLIKVTVFTELATSPDTAGPTSIYMGLAAVHNTPNGFP